MNKILIWGTGKSALRYLSYANILRVEILAYIETHPTKDIFNEKPVIEPKNILNYSFDYIIVASTFVNEICDITNELGISSNKVLFWNRSADEQKIMDISLPLNINEQAKYLYKVSKSVMPYQVCNVDNTNYIYNTQDNCISSFMVKYDETYSKKEIELFSDLANIKCATGGYFLDIGGNIGTTSLFIKNRINKSLKVIAFEPVRENYNMYRINCILNNCEDIIVENLGVSNKSTTSSIKINRSNFGASEIVSENDININDEIDSIQCISLDEYINEHNINPKDIKYIWMDIEGHEANAIEGAKNLLKNTDAFLFVEYNVSDYIMKNMYESILKNLSEIYKYFICSEQYLSGRIEKRPINELALLKDEIQRENCNILLMK
jgi:FkbM family methyltransferase